MKQINKLLWEAEESLKNMDKPSYNKKAWYHNFCLCMDQIMKRGDELKAPRQVERYDNLCKEWK